MTVTVDNLTNGEMIDVDFSAQPPCAMRWGIVIDPDARTVSFDTQRASDRNSVTMLEHHGRTYTIWPEASGPICESALVEYLRSDDGQAMLSRICNGYSEDWDGRNTVGQLTDDAQSALDTLTNDVSRGLTWADRGFANAGVCDAADYYTDDKTDLAAELGITPDTTDDDLSKIIDRLSAEAKLEYVAFYNLDSFVESIREHMQELIAD